MIGSLSTSSRITLESFPDEAENVRLIFVPSEAPKLTNGWKGSARTAIGRQTPTSAWTCRGEKPFGCMTGAEEDRLLEQAHG